MNDFTLTEVLSMSTTPIVNAVRRFLIKIELRNSEYHLKHIADTRRNDYLVEREIHKRQVHLTSELRRLEAK